jgi:hypothetical protein
MISPWGCVGRALGFANLSVVPAVPRYREPMDTLATEAAVRFKTAQWCSRAGRPAQVRAYPAYPSSAIAYAVPKHFAGGRFAGSRGLSEEMRESPSGILVIRYPREGRLPLLFLQDERDPW